MRVSGRFGRYGGRFAAETLMEALIELEEALQTIGSSEEFSRELSGLLSEYAGRPTPLTFCPHISEDLGCRVFLKREDLLHGGAHKINNTLAQALLAKKMGKKRIIAETGAGQHGVASAIAGAALGMPVEVYMGQTDCERQRLNVFRMELLGARVIPVAHGTKTLRDAVSEAMREWACDPEGIYYLLGSVVGPHPYPLMVRDFQSVIGEETRAQICAREGRCPDAAIACVGGGSNAIGMFYPFLSDPVRLIGVEAGGRGSMPGEHSSTLSRGAPGILHGAFSYLLQDENGQVEETFSIAAGLDYPGVGPEHSLLKDTGRVEYGAASDAEVKEAFSYLSRREGIIPALESAHAIAHLCSCSDEFEKDDIVVVCLSGRGDKDVARMAGGEI